MRKLLGYRLKEEYKEYRQASLTLGKVSHFFRTRDYDFKESSNVHDRLKQAGVMHWFEEVYEEDKLEVGKWYTDEGHLVYFQGYNTLKSYGIQYGNWTSNWNITRDWEELRLATPEEIEQALIKEATKRGFKEGVRFRSLIGTGNEGIVKHITDKGIGFNKDDYYLYANAGYIFKDGKWAEILPTETLNGNTAIIDGVEYELKIK